MATKTNARKTSTLDLKSLAAELGVPVKEGKVTAVRDSYYITVGQTKKQIPVGEIIDTAQIKSLVGKSASVIISGRNIVAIAGAIWKPPIIVCYIPVPDFIKQIRPELRETLINAYASRKVITPEVQERLLEGR
jgi:hypothetical protein